MILRESAQELPTAPVGHRVVLLQGQPDLEKITHFFRASENARAYPDRSRTDRFRVAAPPHDANQIIATFARLIWAHVMHRRPIAELLKPPPRLQPKQPQFDLGLPATSAAHRHRIARTAIVMERAA